MNRNTLITSVVVSIVVVLAGYFLLPNGTTVNNTTTTIPQENLGAVPGNEINGNYFTVGGVQFASISQSWIATTTRVCIIKNPFKATTTLMSFTARNTNAVPGVNYFDIATTTHAGGYGSTSTSPILRGVTIAANSYQQTDGVTNGSTRANLPVILGAKETVQFVRYATTTEGTDNYTGVCTATFQKL
jgi:hypothetical protein